MAQITTTDICKSYGSFEALANVNIDVSDGDFLTLLGPSGSGKTTFLMILAGFTEPTTGQLFKNGTNISHVPAEKRNFGMVFQGYALFPHMSVWQNIEYPLRIRQIPYSRRKELVGRIIETVGLGQHSRKKPSQLSGGQQQRVALARSLVFEPDMLLLDEPLSALDRNLREQMQKELKRVHRETGTTFVFVTHDQGEALAMSDKIAIFNQGRLIQSDTPNNIYNHPNSRFVAEFLGQINVFPIQNFTHESNLIIGTADDMVVSAPMHNRLSNTKINAIAVRPEHMTLSIDKPKIERNAVATRVIDFTYQGSHTNLQLTTDHGLPISVSTQSSYLKTNPKIGEMIWVSWSSNSGIALTD